MTIVERIYPKSSLGGCLGEKQRWLLITVSGDERERENKIDRSRPPKVFGVEKNTQMVSPFGWKLKKDIHLETIQMGYVLDNKWFSQTLYYIRDVVQLVEYLVWDQDVVSSSLAIPT